MDYYKYYESQSGSGPVFQGARFQKGYGLGGIFSKFFKWITPVLKTHAIPLLKSGAQSLGTEAVKAAANIVTDAIHGKNFEESAKQHGNEAFQTLKNKAQSVFHQKGSGKKRKKQNRKVISKKIEKRTRRLKDIFDF